MLKPSKKMPAKSSLFSGICEWHLQMPRSVFLVATIVSARKNSTQTSPKTLLHRKSPPLKTVRLRHRATTRLQSVQQLIKDALNS